MVVGQIDGEFKEIIGRCIKRGILAPISGFPSVVSTTYKTESHIPETPAT
ncbi:MAG TPA: hypothetical protein IGS17_08245 [Oscillatoriales cyanobacterium M59_W2019_021]|nr:hypothetical protein [Oscillatoriales cyanobacterium M4454_W2019_049]HIK50897.1 hypothetical protein [Oscillatoriales cyanobacterium M59_W2019_021]